MPQKTQQVCACPRRHSKCVHIPSELCASQLLRVYPQVNCVHTGGTGARGIKGESRLLRLPVMEETPVSGPTILSRVPANVDEAIRSAWQTLSSRLCECVAAGIGARISREVKHKDELQMTTRPTRAKYTVVFDAAEAIAVSLSRCTFYPVRSVAAHVCILCACRQVCGWPYARTSMCRRH